MTKFKKITLGLILSFVAVFSAVLFIPKNEIDSVSAFTYNGVTYSDKVWVSKSWNGMSNVFNGRYFWNDGTNVYVSYNTQHYVLDISTSTWSVKTWTGLTSFVGENVWTDGTNIYYSSGTRQYVLDISTSTWSAKTWTGLTSFEGQNVWTDGTNIYYSYNYNHYVLDISTSTWSVKTWNGLSNFTATRIWTDGTNIYFSINANQYILDISTSTWSAKTWYGLTNFNGSYVWTDGTNIYYSATNISSNYILDISTSTWSSVNFTDLYNSFDGLDVWHFGNKTFLNTTNTYLSAMFIDFDDLLGGGYDEGYTDGYNAGETAGYSSGYSAGESAGYTSGYTAGESVGYDTGYDSGYDVGYDEGYSDGYDLSSNVGYQEGYQDGYNVGYNSGYDNGYLEYSKLGFFPYDNFNLPTGVNLSSVAYLQCWYDGSQYHLGNQFIYDDNSSQWLYFAYNFPVSASNAEYRYYYWFFDGYRVNAICSDNSFPSYYLNNDGTFTEFNTSVSFNFYNNITSSKYLNLSAVSEFEGSLYIYSQTDNKFYRFNSLVHDFDLLDISSLPSVAQYTKLQNFVVMRDSSSNSNRLILNACYLYNRSLNGVIDYQFNYYYCDLDSVSLTMVFNSTFDRHQSNNGSLNVSESGFWTDGSVLYFAFTDLSGKIANYSLRYIPAESVNENDTFERVVFPLLEGPIFVNYLKKFNDIQYLFTYINYVDTSSLAHPTFLSNSTLVYTFHLYDIDMYDTGYNIGYIAGVDYSTKQVNKSSASYTAGYQDGISNAGNYTFNGLLGSVIDVPVRTFTSLLNFNVLGVNIMDFLLGLMTLAFVVFIVKMVLGGR